jgi:methionine aminopeptidase
MCPKTKYCAWQDKGKKIEKGIAFPTCISVNEILGHFSPLKGDATAAIACRAAQGREPSQHLQKTADVDK